MSTPETSQDIPHTNEINPQETTPTQGYAQLPLPQLQPNDIRIISHNINTLQTITPAELGATFDLYQEFDPTIIGIQECNKNWTNYTKTEGPLRDALNRRWPGTKLVTAHCRESVFTGHHQPGGVAQMVLRKLTGRVVARGSDKLGRYAWQEIILDGTRKLLMITAYRIPQESLIGCGHETSAMQQWRKLRARGIDNPRPRKQMLEDLFHFASPYEKDGNEIIITIDANSPAEDAKVEQFMEALNLQDLMAAYLPDTPPPTYQRGTNKIDHIWGTTGVLTSIIGAGILPFGAGPRSDHPILYIDLSLDALCDIPSQSLTDPTHPSSRNLWSTDIKAAKVYIELVRNGCEFENLFARTAILTQRCERTGRCTPDDERILNKIDDDLTKIMLRAERECKKAKGHAWSPLLAHAGQTVIAAKWNLSDIFNGRIQIPPGQRADVIQQAKQQLKEAYATLRTVQQNAKTIRERFLEDRAEHLADTQNVTKAAALRQLLRAERQSNIFRRLGLWMKGKEHVTLDRILVPDDPDNPEQSTWTSIVEAQALFEVLVATGQEHYNQAANTPFATGPIADKLGSFADNDYCDAILQGTIDIDALAAITEVKDLIRGMQYPDPSNPTTQISSTITSDGFADMVKHSCERTSSSPSGRHYGHYRTLLRDPDILGIVATLANFCFKWGKSLTRWEQVTQTLIPKEPGTPKITRIRRITLIEADLNMCLSELFGRRMMDNAESHGLLHKAQYGSRKGKMAISAVLLKRLSYDIIRQSRMDACVVDNDATACYDRIIPSIAMIKSRRAGMPREATNVFLTLLFRMAYYVRTAYGVSSAAYSNIVALILGVMQGAGHSGALWAITSSVMFDQMENTHGATFHSPNPHRSLRRTGEAFVDDTTLWLLKFGLMLSVAAVLMQTTAQRWERLLFATGGALNLAKCHWYGIEWTFSATGEAKMNPTTEGHTITLTAGATPEHAEILQRVSTADGRRTLGVRLAPDGNDNMECEYRIQQATKMGNRIRAAPLGREHISIGFRAIWKMMIQYPLGATCFNSQQCHRIQTKYLPSFLSKMGINRTTAKAVRHGPTQYGGMDNFNLETEQGVQHASLMVSHIRKDDEVGRMLRISIDHMQLQAGVSWPVLSQPGHIQRKYVDPCYVSNTWEFLDRANTHLQYDIPPLLLPQRHGDSFLMEDFARLPNITTNELVHAQRCRLHLEVTTLADICSSDGLEICEWALRGTPMRTSTLKFPRQDRPSPRVWQTWNALLRRCYSTRKAQKLDNTMGLWYKGRISQVWDTVIDPNTNLVYIWNDNKVRIYERQGRSTKQYRHLKPHTSNSFPLGCVPITGDFQSGRFVASGYVKQSANPLPYHNTFAPSMHIMNRGVKTSLPLATVAQAIWDGHAMLGTDGSVHTQKATYSWIISTSLTNINADVCGGGCLPSPARYTEHYSKRPEAAAIYAGLHWISHLLRRFPDTTPTAGNTPDLPIYVDNKAVIQDIDRHLDNLTPTFEYLRTDHDIIQGIKTLRAQLPIPITISHVKSHQDRKIPFPALSPDAQINILADRKADEFHRSRNTTIGTFPTWIPGTRAALYRGSFPITQHLPAYLRTSIHSVTMQEYLIRRSHEGTGRTAPWDNYIFESIAWQPLGEAFRKFSTGQRIQLSKYMNDLLPTGRHLQAIDNTHNGRCFVCGLLWEDTNHVIRCSGETRSAARAEAFKAFRSHLKRQHTPDVMANLITECMNKWTTQHPITRPIWPIPMEPIHRSLSRAYTAQSKIGWDQFFRGRIATEWKHSIQIYYKERKPGTAFTPDQWMRTTINAIWTFALTLWRQRNLEYHGDHGQLTDEAKRKATLARATAAYNTTKDQVLPSDSQLLHRHPVTSMVNWTKQHLDAYLATAEMACEWNIDDG